MQAVYCLWWKFNHKKTHSPNSVRTVFTHNLYKMWLCSILATFVSHNVRKSRLSGGILVGQLNDCKILTRMVLQNVCKFPWHHFTFNQYVRNFPAALSYSFLVYVVLYTSYVYAIGSEKYFNTRLSQLKFTSSSNRSMCICQNMFRHFGFVRDKFLYSCYFATRNWNCLFISCCLITIVSCLISSYV